MTERTLQKKKSLRLKSTNILTLKSVNLNVLSSTEKKSPNIHPVSFELKASYGSAYLCVFLLNFRITTYTCMYFCLNKLV